jgi:hypothetical protein
MDDTGTPDIWFYGAITLAVMIALFWSFYALRKTIGKSRGRTKSGQPFEGPPFGPGQNW